MINDWKNLQHIKWNSLLLGNGFSIGISKNFRYDSLLKRVDEEKIEMYPHARRLFSKDKIGTTNFEEVLRVIYHAYLVGLVSKTDLDAIKSLYFNVQKSLIEAVTKSHVSYSDVPVSKIEDALSGYDRIFTTNYDLIPYWSIMNSSFTGYCDYFWSGNCEFDISNTEIWNGDSPIYYLHGAIHLRARNNGTTCKVRATGGTTIQDVISSKNMEEIPLFISEGKSQIKLRRIRENDYLNFCYNKLLKASGSLVSFGHGLDKEYDEHILDAIKSSELSEIAISVFSDLNSSEKNVFTSNVEAFFANSGKQVYFFESKTHPLSCVHA